jgi:hypothetical protein
VRGDKGAAYPLKIEIAKGLREPHPSIALARSKRSRWARDGLHLPIQYPIHDQLCGGTFRLNSSRHDDFVSRTTSLTWPCDVGGRCALAGSLVRSPHRSTSPRRLRKDASSYAGLPSPSLGGVSGLRRSHLRRLESEKMPAHPARRATPFPTRHGLEGFGAPCPELPQRYLTHRTPRSPDCSQNGYAEQEAAIRPAWLLECVGVAEQDS